MSLAEEIAAHDAKLAARDLVIWIGAEPTFTRADSVEPCWLFDAEGGDKEARAQALLLELVPRLAPGAELCRAQGRHFPEEEKPRFALGARWRRDEVAAGMTGSLEGEPVAPPDPDPDVAWMTVTPDPGVVEVNQAPAPDLAAFARVTAATYAAAKAAQLSPTRVRWNGDLADSGGGGQLTFGGPTFAASPFFRHPHMLPGLLAYLNRHPSLSYAFASECVGSASQGPRPDEGDPQRFAELGLALELLAARAETSPGALWSSLAPLLVDASGNSHRAEVNVEKLASPLNGPRGRLGVVELRALRMPPTAEKMIALAALYRAVLARLAVAPYRSPLAQWGAALHDRCALPALLAVDLAAVLEDLVAHQLGLGPEITALIQAAPAPLCTLGDGDASLTITPACDFWPLVGDVASQERRGARVVDASTARVEIVVRGPGQDPVWAAGRPLPLHPLDGGRAVAGVRFRCFVPKPGFHPDLPAIDPLVIHWRGKDVALHRWRPDGGAYDGLAGDADEAARRRAERVVVTTAPSPAAAPPALRGEKQRPFTMDLRRPRPL